MTRILFVLGYLLLFFSFLELFPFLLDVISGSPNWEVFLVSAFCTFFLGVSLILANKDSSDVISVREAYILLVVIWVSLPLAGSIPFILSVERIHIVDGLFESFSGFTTTGLTVLSDLQKQQPGLLLWRSLLQWSGGIGIIVMGIVILPFLSIGGMELMKSEVSDTPEKVLPRAKEIASRIGMVYLALTVLCFVSYNLAGMTTFDSINHAMSTIATGGFSTHDESFRYFESLTIQWVAIFFMLSGALPFALYVKALGRDPLAIVKNSQVRFFFGTCFFLVLFLTLWLYIIMSMDIFNAFSFAAFNTVSLITTTGFANSDYAIWGSVAVFFLVMTFAGGCSGSTSGSIKIFRYQLMLIFLKSQLNRLIHPHGVFPVRYSGNIVSSEIILSVTAFLSLYLLSWCVLSGVLAFSGIDFEKSISLAASSLTNVGFSFYSSGEFGIILSELSYVNKFVLMAGMLIGRLELFSIFVLFTPNFWKGV